MKSVSVSISEDVYRRAQNRAAETNTSLSAVVKEFLTRFAGEETEFERKKRLQDEVLAGISKFRGGNRISRDAAHDCDEKPSPTRVEATARHI
jgi:hypothetical protein